MAETISPSDLHPRPQLRRDRWIDLCGAWGFAFDDEDIGLAERWFDQAEPFSREIMVPFPPESERSGVHDTGFHPVVWYRREIQIGDADRRGRLMLHFGAVDYKASVWVNGRLAVEHVGGQTPFSADIAPLLVPGDVQKSGFCVEAVRRTLDAFGRLDIVVNNAAYQQHQKSIEDITDEQLDRTFRTNIYGYFYMTRAAIPHLKPGSTIINTGSITGLEGSRQLLDYSATKGAIHAFTKSLAQNLIDRKIRVNCVSPGPVWTPLNPSDKPAAKVATFGADTPMKRPAQPEEIAPAFVFFASNADSSYITGEVLALLGGETTAA